MKERAILMQGAMVRALLDGSKTQTRRIVKQLDPTEGAVTKGHDGKPMGACWAYGGPVINCPYGQPGDRLWVREAWCMATPLMGIGKWPTYRATCHELDEKHLKWKPSIHMPRAISRIQLEIVSVRVERLNDISEADAMAEGCFFTDYGRKCGHGGGWKEVGNCPGSIASHPQREGWMWDATTSHDQCIGSARSAYGNLWESINGAGSWAANPWVWVVEFKRVAP